MNVVDIRELERRVARVSALIASHFGGIELVGVSDDGVVRIRFTGMCFGCALRPLTLAASVRPALLAVEGVSRVEMTGGGWSRQAEERLGVLGDREWPLRAIVHRDAAAVPDVVTKSRASGPIEVPA